MPLVYSNIDNNNNNNNNNNDDEYDSEAEDEEIFYQDNEISCTKYNIVLCELFNSLIHGKTNSEVNKHYLNICTFKQLNMDAIYELCELYNEGYIERINIVTPHKFIRNYENIITRSDYIKPEIAEIIYLESGHNVCIIKTIWLKLVQRAWKKNYERRKNIIRQRCSLESLEYRRITGNWPDNYRYLPGLRGMLSSLLK
jgi:hypothetical protein